VAEFLRPEEKLAYVKEFCGNFISRPRQILTIREVKHDVNGRGQTAKITSDFEFFSSNP